MDRFFAMLGKMGRSRTVRAAIVWSVIMVGKDLYGADLDPDMTKRAVDAFLNNWDVLTATGAMIGMRTITDQSIHDK